MQISEQVYKGGTTPKTTTRTDSDGDSHVSKRKEGEYASHTNPDVNTHIYTREYPRIYIRYAVTVRSTAGS